MPIGDSIAAVLRCGVLLTVFLMTGWMERKGAFTPAEWVIAVGSIYVLVTTAMGPARAGTWRYRTRILTTVDLLVITALLYTTGGLSSQLYVLYYLPVLAAALRLDLRDAIGAAVLAAACYVLIGFVGGRLDVPIPVYGIPRMATFAVSALIIAWLLGMSAKHARLQRDERERAQELLNRTAAIYEVARTINATLDLEELISRLAQTARRECGADAARVVLVEDGGEPQVRGTAGPAEVFGDAGEIGAATTWVLQHEDALAIRAGRASAKAASGVQAPGSARHYLAAPMICGGRMAGVIELASRGTGGFREVDEDVLSVVAAQAAVAVQNARQYGRAQLLASTDRLTGMWNHAEFQVRLQEEIARAQRNGRPMCLLLADVDNFKGLNDANGHRMGDDLLRQIAARMQGAVRCSDFAARYGGDEFAVILPETALQGASVAADNMRRAVTLEPFAVAGRRVTVTVSGGLACYPEDGATPEALIDACDRALVEAKRSGGNYVRLHSHL